MSAFVGAGGAVAAARLWSGTSAPWPAFCVGAERGRGQVGKRQRHSAHLGQKRRDEQRRGVLVARSEPRHERPCVRARRLLCGQRASAAARAGGPGVVVARRDHEARREEQQRSAEQVVEREHLAARPPALLSKIRAWEGQK